MIIRLWMCLPSTSASVADDLGVAQALGVVLDVERLHEVVHHVVLVHHVALEISDAEAGALPADYVNATLKMIPFPPAIGSHRYGTNVLISWPTAAADFVLQTNITRSPGSWGVFPIAPTTSGSENTVTLPASTGAMYYRLLRP